MNALSTSASVRALLARRHRVLHLDWETRGTLDLKEVGAHKYARHQDTHVLIGAYLIRWSDEPFDPSQVRVWRTWEGEPIPDDLYDALVDPTVIVEAWNAQFERLIAAEMFRRWSLEDDIDEDYAAVQLVSRWHCTAARARACGLSGKLEIAARFLHVPMQKDMAGARLMKRWTKPLADGSWADEPEEYGRFVAYCVQDVRTEGSIGLVLRDLTETEWVDYAVNEKKNDRGIPVDVVLARAAQHYARDEDIAIRAELKSLTGGVIETPKQHKRLKDWIIPRVNDYVRELLTTTNKKGEETYTLDKAARASILEDEDVRASVSDDVITVLELVDDAGRSSVAKFKAIEEREIDGRIYGCYILNGAGQTGRYSATGFQPHNLPVREKIANVEETIALIVNRAPVEAITACSGKNILTTLACLLRPVVCVAGARGGGTNRPRRLRWADYSSVEARALPWLANDPLADDLLATFARGGDVYIRTAAEIFGLDPEELLRAYKGGDKDAYEKRQTGKVAILALGFGGGVNALKKMARLYNIELSDQLADVIVKMWRRSNVWAPRFWKALHRAACNAVAHPGTVYEAGRVSYLMSGTTLWCLLPCGRILCYPEARIRIVEGRYGPERVLSAAKGNWHPKAGSVDGWPRHTLWHGILAENVTQAICASLLRASQRLLDEWGWPAVMDTHDEDLIEVEEDEEEEAARALEAAMLHDHGWNRGLPLAVETTGGMVYGKH